MYIYIYIYIYIHTCKHTYIHTTHHKHHTHTHTTHTTHTIHMSYVMVCMMIKTKASRQKNRVSSQVDYFWWYFCPPPVRCPFSVAKIKSIIIPHECSISHLLLFLKKLFFGLCFWQSQNFWIFDFVCVFMHMQHDVKSFSKTFFNESLNRSNVFDGAHWSAEACHATDASA